MEKIIEFEINNKDDFFDKYNSKKISTSLISYLINNTPEFSKEDKIIVFYKNNTKEDIDVERLIKEELNSIYKTSLNRHWRNDLTQLIYFFLGVIGIFISSLINNSVIKEVVLIGGSVFIWALLEIEIYTEIEGKKKRRILNKLLNSEFEEIK